jgi:hypothetical protein
VAACTAVGAAREFEVEECLAVALGLAVFDRFHRGGVDLLLDLGGQVAGVARQRIFTLETVLARDLDAVHVGDQVVDLLGVHRATTHETPRRHR